MLILTAADIARLMSFADHLEAVADAFRIHGEGGSTAPPPLHIPVEGGGFHAKAAYLALGPGYAAVKVNANFPDNPTRCGAPTIQGAVLLFDAADGTPLALLDSIEITRQRTAAATALAARYLARRDSSVVTVCGCGQQGEAQLVALMHVLPLRRAFAWDIDAARAERFAARMAQALAIEIEPAALLAPATLASDVIVTCTTAHEPFLGPDEVRPGSFVAAVGADNPRKSEIVPALMRRSKIVVDVLEQCVVMGDLHHAIAAGAVTKDDVHAELAELVAGRRPGREGAVEITLFDSTGTAIEDVAASARAFERARQRGAGTELRLGPEPP